MTRLRIAFAVSLLLICAPALIAAENPATSGVGESLETAAGEAVAVTEEAEVSAQERYGLSLDAAAAERVSLANSCPQGSSFTCSEPCYDQRVTCIDNCNGNFPCVAVCMYCYRECVFTC